jgi:hypothetical protein
MVASRDKKLIAKKADELGHLLSEAIGKLLEANKGANGASGSRTSIPTLPHRNSLSTFSHLELYLACAFD